MSTYQESTYEDLKQSEYERNQSEGAGSFSQPIGSVPVRVVGKHGKVRHAGFFSTNNPYALQINPATSNQDKDALYEKAVNWEADRANLLEQREYDDPVNQAARERRAGINPDLQGSGGSGGVSSGSSAVQPQTQGQTKFNNAYDNTDKVLSGIDTAASAISAFTSGYTGIVTSLDTLFTLPSISSLVIRLMCILMRAHGRLDGSVLILSTATPLITSVCTGASELSSI